MNNSDSMFAKHSCSHTTKCSMTGYGHLYRFRLKSHLDTGAYLGDVAPMASAEIAPLSKHMTPKIVITITSAKKIMIMQLIVTKYY